jgi:hypothetical protein
MTQQTQQWARPDKDGFAVEVTDLDPAGRFHPSIQFHPVPPEFVGLMDHQYQWNGETWDEPELGYAMRKMMKAKENELTDIIQRRLDVFAKTRGYDGIMSAATYATSTAPKFQAEGQYAVLARDLTWAKAYAILDDVLSGLRPMPTMEEVFAELPVLAWPE